MTGEPIEVPIRVDMTGTSPATRRLYRRLRRAGMQRNDANLVAFGHHLAHGALVRARHDDQPAPPPITEVTR